MKFNLNTILIGIVAGYATWWAFKKFQEAEIVRQIAATGKGTTDMTPYDPVTAQPGYEYGGQGTTYPDYGGGGTMPA
jgi:hypothetical protein